MTPQHTRHNFPFKEKLALCSRARMHSASRERIRTTLLSEIEAKSSHTAAREDILFSRVFQGVAAFIFHTRVGYALLVTFLAIAVSVGTAAAANPARPGDLLFPVDKAVERVQLALAMSPVRRAKVAVRIATERMEELTALTEEVTEEEITPLPETILNPPEATTSVEVVPEGESEFPSTTLEIVATTTPASVEESPKKKKAKENLKKAAEETKTAIKRAFEILGEAEETVKKVPDKEGVQGIDVAKATLTEEAGTSLEVIKKAKETLIDETGETAAAIGEAEEALEGAIVQESVAGESKGEDTGTSTPEIITPESDASEEAGGETEEAVPSGEEVTSDSEEVFGNIQRDGEGGEGLISEEVTPPLLITDEE